MADRTPDEVYASGKNGGALIIQKYPTVQNSEKGSNTVHHAIQLKIASKKGKKYTADFKAKVVLELLEGDLTLNQ
ncbi:MAG: hypothetical protein NTV32_07280, partial [Gammaproteobacteria bacterium]|nr:hypothetical protein [Gammaproteobacteria bacterium]